MSNRAKVNHLKLQSEGSVPPEHLRPSSGFTKEAHDKVAFFDESIKEACALPDSNRKALIRSWNEKSAGYVAQASEKGKGEARDRLMEMAEQYAKGAKAIEASLTR